MVGLGNWLVVVSYLLILMLAIDMKMIPVPVVWVLVLGGIFFCGVYRMCVESWDRWALGLEYPGERLGIKMGEEEMDGMCGGRDSLLS